MQPLRLGILGAGSFAQRRILPILREIKTLELTALHHRNETIARQLQDTYSIPFVTSSREELLSHPCLDAVYITSPNDCHEADALACALAYKPTLCEKPLAPTVAAIERMITAFTHVGVPLFVGQSLRFKWSVQEAQSRLLQGELGDVLHVKAYFCLTVPPGNWRYEKERGGGVLQDIGVHLIDLIRFLTHDELASIVAISPSKNSCDQHVIAMGQLRSGAMYTFECAMNQPLRSGFEIYGTKGRFLSMKSLRQQDPTPERVLWVDDQGQSTFLPVPQEDLYCNELAHFADVLRGKTVSKISHKEGLLNQQAIEAAYVSMEREHVVQL